MGKSKSFKPHSKDKPRLASSKKSKKADKSGIIHGRVETAKTERKRIKRMGHQLQTIANTGVGVDAIMKDVGADVVTKSQKKKMKRKADNVKIILVEEEVKNQMDIDASTGTELGAPQ